MSETESCHSSEIVVQNSHCSPVVYAAACRELSWQEWMINSQFVSQKSRHVASKAGVQWLQTLAAFSWDLTATVRPKKSLSGWAELQAEITQSWWIIRKVHDIGRIQCFLLPFVNILNRTLLFIAITLVINHETFVRSITSRLNVIN